METDISFFNEILEYWNITLHMEKKTLLEGLFHVDWVHICLLQ